jgi:outer membrane receptor protein involved in Fe transport
VHFDVDAPPNNPFFDNKRRQTMKENPKLNLNYVVAALVAGLAMAGPRISTAQAVSPAVEKQNAPSGALEQVVITADKRATVLDKTPETITVLSGSKLAETGMTGLEDVVTLVPNASLATSVLGAVQPYIRGIGNVFNLAGGDPGVALYTDGAYISDQTSAGASMFDLQRIEVLRGPQGALYGRNATGGAMNLISAKPTDTFKGQASVLFGNYGRKELEGFLSGPLGDSSTSARLSFQLKKRDGYAPNAIAGNVYGPVTPGAPGAANSVAPNGLDDLNSRALRFQTYTDLGQDGSVRLIANASRQKDNGPNVVALPDAGSFTSIGFGVPSTAKARSAVYNGASNFVNVDTLQAIYERPMGSNTLRVSASTRNSKSFRDLDLDGTSQTIMSDQFTNRSTDRSVDAHIASDESGAWRWLLGATYLDFDQTQSNQVNVVFPGFFFGAPGSVPTYLNAGGVVKTRSNALYGDVRYALTPNLSIGAGLRLSRDEKSATEYSSFPAFGLNGTAAPSAAWSSTPGHVGLEWNISQETMAYAKAAHGFKSGAINLGALQPQTVKPESVTSFEIGAKTSFLDKKGSFSAALFTSSYKDMQLTQIGNLATILGNASQAKINGFEMEMLVRPISALTLGASLGLMDPTFTDFTNTDQNLRSPQVGPISLKGNQLPNVSRAQASLSAEWRQVMGAYQTSLSANYVWRDKFYFNEFNTADAMQAAYGVLNLAASMRPTGGKWKVYAQLRNATNTSALTSLSIYAPTLMSLRAGTYTPPRNLGVGVSLDF